MKESTPKKKRCCEVCRRSNAICYGCSCHTLEGTQIKENLESMNNGVIFSPSHEEWVEKPILLNQEEYMALKNFEAGRKQGLEEARKQKPYQVCGECIGRFQSTQFDGLCEHQVKEDKDI